MKAKRLLALLLAVVSSFMLLGVQGVDAADLSYQATAAYSSSHYYNRFKALKLTGDRRLDIVSIAFSQLGYHEGDGLADLDGGNRQGASNYTEYGYWFGTRPMGNNSGFYNAWCAFFVSWCARQAGVPESILSNAAYARPDSSSYSGGYGYFHLDPLSPKEYTPRSGDLVFIDWSADGTWDHVGFVSYVDGDSIGTIEGNAADGVRHRVYDKNDPEIRAYGAPRYDENERDLGSPVFECLGKAWQSVKAVNDLALCCASREAAPEG